MKSHLSTKEIQTIRKKLPHGGIKKIAESIGKDQSTVSRVLNGEFTNDEIIVAAIELIELSKEKNASIKDRISAL